MTKRVLLAALAALALVCPNAWAQSAQVDGTLTTITTDAVTLDIQGTRYATVKFRVRTAGTATAAAKISIDGGYNFIAAPYAKRISTVAANPTVQAIATTTLVAGDIWEVPLPANATQFQLACDGTGTTTSVSVLPGLPWQPGVPVTAVLYDVTSGTNAALDTGTLDTSGWALASHFFNMSAGTPAFSVQFVDDAGTSSANLATWAVASYGNIGGGASNMGVGAAAGIAQTTHSFLPKRIRYQSAAIVAQTSRIRVEVRR